MDNYQDGHLEAFYKKLLEIKDKEAQKALSQEELKNIAFELGFSEDEWHLVEEKVEGHLKNGHTFLEYKNWQDAIEEFENALQLSPNNLAATYGLTLAFYSMFKEKRQNTYKDKAIHYARIRLKNEPGHEPSIRIISELQKQPKVTNTFNSPNSVPPLPHTNTSLKPAPNPAKAKMPLIVGMALFGVMMAGVIAFVSMRKSASKRRVNREYIEKKETSNWGREKPEQNRRESSRSPSNNWEGKSGNPLQSKGLQFPTKFVTNEYSDGLTLASIDQSKSNSSRRMYYRLAGAFKVNGDKAIKRLTLKVDFIDHDDKVLLAEFIDVFKRYNKSIAIPGDYLHFSAYKSKARYTPDDFKEIRISVHTIQRIAVPSSITRKSIPINWAFDPASNVKLELQEREQELKNFSSSCSHKVTVNFINAGTIPLTALKVEIQWLDKEGNVLSNKTRTIMHKGMGTVIRPGQNITHRFIAYLKGVNASDLKGYKITIVDAEEAIK